MLRTIESERAVVHAGLGGAVCLVAGTIREYSSVYA